MENLLPGEHPVHVAPDGVDLAVVEDESVGVGPLPGGVGVGGEAGVDAGNGAAVLLVLQIQVEPAQLIHQEHALIHNGPAGQGGDVGVVVGLLKDPAGDVQLPVKVQPFLHPLRAADKGLLDVGHLVQRLLAQDFRVDGHLAPAQKLHALLGHNDLEHLLGLVAPQGVLGEEEHAHAVIPLAAQLNAQFGRLRGEKAVGDLEQNAHAVAGLSLGVPAGPVLQLFHNAQGVVYRLVTLTPLDVYHHADAAGIVLKLGIIEALLVIALLSILSLHTHSLPSRSCYGLAAGVRPVGMAARRPDYVRCRLPYHSTEDTCPSMEDYPKNEG